MTKVIADHIVINKFSPVEGHYFIKLQSPVEIPKINPGNFAEILVENTPDVFLRRPFSIFDVHYEKRWISFYVKVIGKGTKRLGELQEGDKVNLIYPLGNSFNIPVNAGKVLIVTGGSGIAPFILLGKELKKRNVNVVFLLGGKSGKEIFLTEEFSKYGDVLVTTEDGTKGEKGLVTGHSLFKGTFDFNLVYTCGPDGMMKAVAGIAKKHGVMCQACLENMMACGFGICLCCVTPTHEGNKRVCYEGPVFDVNYLKWQT